MAELLSTRYELAKFKIILEERVSELESGMHQRDGIAIEKNPDQ
jgi:hypothetical protein